MDEARGRLKVTVKHALQLPVVKHHALGRLGPRMNPYVILTLGSDSRQTQVHSGGHRDPVWNDQVTFDMLPGLGDLDIRVMHKGSLTGRDTELAYGKVSGESLHQFRGFDQKVTLHCQGQGPGCSILVINVLYEPEQRQRSSSVDTPIRRQSLGNPRSSLTQGSEENPAWMGTGMMSTSYDPSAISPRRGSLGTPHSSSGIPAKVGPEKVKSSKISKLGSYLIRGKKDKGEDKSGASTTEEESGGLSNRSSCPEDVEKIPSMPVPIAVLQSLSDRPDASPSSSPQTGAHERLHTGGSQPHITDTQLTGTSSDMLSSHGSKYASPERAPRGSVPPRMASGFRMPPAEEYPIRTKTQWLEDYENRRRTESSVPDFRESNPPESRFPNRRMTETSEGPTAPMYEPSMSIAQGYDPNRARFRGGREVREHYEYDGPMHPDLKLPTNQNLGGIGEGAPAHADWQVSAQNYSQESNLRNREAEWRETDPNRFQSQRVAHPAAVPIMEEAMHAVVTNNRPNPGSSSQDSGPGRSSRQENTATNSDAQFPQLQYSGQPGESLSERFEGLGLAEDKSVFDSLLRQREADGNGQTPVQGQQGRLPGNSIHNSMGGQYNHGYGDADDPPQSLRPVMSPFAAPDSGANEDHRNPLPAQPPEARQEAASTARYMTVPFRDVKKHMESGDENEVAVKPAVLSSAITSVSSSGGLEKDSWLIDESELTVAVDSRGMPIRLGKGAFGEVFKGELNFSPVAIKVLNVNSSKSLKDALSEMKVLQQIHHAHIVRLMGYTITEEVDVETQVRTVKKVKLVTELLHENLWDALRKGRFTWHKGGSRIAFEIAAGLYQTTKKGIWHLDLKSPNILLTDNGHAKIADFGLASVVGLQQSAKGHGTFEWAPPELLMGKPPLTDKTDVFSLGVVYWEICTGLPPQRSNLRAITPEEAPEEISDLVFRCIRDQDERPSVEEILIILKKYVP